MRWRRQKSRIFVCFEEVINSGSAVPGAYSAPRNTLIHDALFRVLLLLFSTLLCFWKVIVICSVSANLVASNISQGLRSSRVLCCGKTQRPIRHNILGISGISQGLMSSRMWCIGNVLHPVRCLSLGISDTSQGFGSYRMCWSKASHPKWPDNLKSPTDISSVHTQFIFCLLD